MKILITGATGFIGTHLCPLLAQEHQVLAYSRGVCQISDDFASNKNIRFIKGDVCDQKRLRAVMADAELVVHLASTTIPSTSNSNPKNDVETNLLGALNVLDGACAQNIKRLVFISSGGTVYGENNSGKPLNEDSPTNPISSYGIVKLAIEKYIAMYHVVYGLPYAILRVSNPYGQNQYRGRAFGAMSVFHHKIQNDEEIQIWGDGSARRDFIHVSDVTKAIQLACFSRQQSMTLNIGSGQSIALSELISIIANRVQKVPKIKYKDYRGYDVQNVKLDISRAKSALGWEPVISLKKGIDLLVNDSFT